MREKGYKDSCPGWTRLPLGRVQTCGKEENKGARRHPVLG